ncbi:hypothetical protein [Microbacterium sp. Root280D1]|uniref:hypothetical protein n=2 Tax=unclassified Microbacterium TaxID=2609290 RepID=UPI001F26DE1D|nr:hypothetical protein [Microbacterium sp. Root280D1]
MIPKASDMSRAIFGTPPRSTLRIIDEVNRLQPMFSVSENLKSVLGSVRMPSYVLDPALQSAASAALRASSLTGSQGFKGILGSIQTPSYLSDPMLKSAVSKALEVSSLSTGLTNMLRGSSMINPKIDGPAGLGFPVSLFAPMQSIVDTQLTSLKGFTGLQASLLGDLSWISELTKGLKLGRPHLPSNWRGVETEPDELEDEVRAILEEGIPLAWVPSARVIELLLAAPDASSRRRVISNNHKGIVTSCERLVSRLAQKRALLYGDMIRKAINALRDGHVEAAQSLATNVLDTLVTQHSKAALQAPLGVVTNVASYKKFRKRSWRLTLAVHPVTTIMSGRYTVDDRPDGYRRNATAHAITRHQYNRINTVLAIMNATSLLTCFVRDTPAFD